MRPHLHVAMDTPERKVLEKQRNGERKLRVESPSAMSTHLVANAKCHMAYCMRILFPLMIF